MTKYLCWNCGLMQGDEQDPQGPSQLCPACRAAIEAGSRLRDTAAYYQAQEEEVLDLRILHATNLTGTTYHEEDGHA